MVELGTRRITERVHVGNSPPKAARAEFLSQVQGFGATHIPTATYPAYDNIMRKYVEADREKSYATSSIE